MTKSITAKDADIVTKVIKDTEFKHFIKIVGGEGKLPEHWQLLAQALGIHQNTITRWMKMPEFEEARVKGINRRLKAMEESGKDDWRQWEASLRLLGVKEDSTQTTNIQINMPTFQVMSEQARQELESLYEGLTTTND